MRPVRGWGRRRTAPIVAAVVAVLVLAVGGFCALVPSSPLDRPMSVGVSANPSVRGLTVGGAPPT